MAWNPEAYNKFKSERSAPFRDLVALLNIKTDLDVIDLGCGTGQLTRQLSDILPGAKVLGIDSSAEMLEDARAFENEHVKFELSTIEEQLDSSKKWDLVFSNAAIQWVNNHVDVFPKIISLIKPGGQLLIQMPAQHHNLTNLILADLAGEEPYASQLKSWKRISPVLDINQYAKILFDNKASSITAFEKIYPVIVDDADKLYDWISGTGMIPYLERLPENWKSPFITEYKRRMHNEFSGTPVFYPFKRMILEARF